MILDLGIKNIRRLLKNQSNFRDGLRDILVNIKRNIEVAKKFNPLVTDTIDNALESLDWRLKDLQNSPLLGSPFVVKDNILTKGIRTTAASKILSNFVPPFSATAVNKLETAGAMIVGKANLDEFGMGSKNLYSFFGPCLNPWDSERTPGGSSGGSAVAVALRLCSFALGSDTGGSVRLPASYCCCYGLKPTYGRVSRWGLIAFGSSLDQIGVLATDIETCATALEIMSGVDANDSTTVDYKPLDIQKALEPTREIKLGYLDVENFKSAIDPEILRVFDQAVQFFTKEGVEVKPVKLNSIEYAIPCYYVICTAEAASNLSRYDGVRYGWSPDNLALSSLDDFYHAVRSQGFGEEVRRRILVGTFVLSSGYHGRYYQKALKVRRLIQNEFSQTFEKVDAILLPTSPNLPPKFKGGAASADDVIKDYLADIFTVCANLGGFPAVSFPAGFSSSGLPIGLQLMTNHFREDVLYKLCSLFELNHEFHKAVPPALIPAEP